MCDGVFNWFVLQLFIILITVDNLFQIYYLQISDLIIKFE